MATSPRARPITGTIRSRGLQQSAPASGRARCRAAEKTWCGNGGGADVAPAPRAEGRQGLKILMFVRGLFLAFLGHFALPPYLPVPFSDPFSPPLPLVGIICITHQHQKIAGRDDVPLLVGDGVW